MFLGLANEANLCHIACHLLLLMALVYPSPQSKHESVQFWSTNDIGNHLKVQFTKQTEVLIRTLVCEYFQNVVDTD